MKIKIPVPQLNFSFISCILFLCIQLFFETTLMVHSRFNKKNSPQNTIPTHLFSNSPNHKSSNPHILTFSNSHILTFSNFQILKFSHFQILTSSNSHILTFSNFQILTSSHFQSSFSLSNASGPTKVDLISSISLPLLITSNLIRVLDE